MADIKAIRAKYENKLYELMNDFDPSGYNTNNYKAVFSKMSDREFINICKQMISQEDFIFSLDINELDKGKDELTLDKIKKISKKHKIPLTEYVVMPFRNPNGEPSITTTEVPIVYVQVRRFFQQMLQHKNAISNNNDKINPLTGQVVKDDKTASTTNVQTYALSVVNLNNSIKEYLGPRSDDPVSKQEMLTQIEQTGNVKLADLHINTHNKQALNTAEVFAKAAGINMKFKGNDNFEDIINGSDKTISRQGNNYD